MMVLSKGMPGLNTQISKLPVSARKSVSDALSSGHWALVPAKPVRLGKRLSHAWWKINPSTGITLGIGHGGEGQTYSEDNATRSIATRATLPASTYFAELCTVTALILVRVSGDILYDAAKIGGAAALCIAGQGAINAFGRAAAGGAAGSAGGNAATVVTTTVPGGVRRLLKDFAIGVAAAGAAFGVFVSIPDSIPLFIGDLLSGISGGGNPPALPDPPGWCEDFGCDDENK
jgi:hypothetical protein